jgi:hypothetical protein
MKTPTPGSPEAQEQECTCPVMDNNYGKGIGKPPKFWMNQECPLHGWESKREDLAYKIKELEEAK